MIKKLRIILLIMATFCLPPLVTSGPVIYKLTPTNPHYTAQDLVWSGEKPDGPTFITSQQAKEDISLLLYTLNHAYGGKDFIKPSILAQAKRQLKSIPNNKTISTHTFWYKIDQALLEIPDNHLVVRPPKNLIKSMPGHLKSSHIASRQALYKTRGLGDNKNTTELPWFIETIPYHDKKILLIAITHFPDPQSNQWKGFLTEVKTALDKADAIILDLRNNRGGNSAMADELAELLYNNSDVPDPVDCIYFNNTPETYIIYANRIREQIEEGLAKGDYTAALQKKYDDLLEKAEQAKQKNSPKYDIRKRPLFPTPANLIKKPIAILINKRCGSSGEIMVDLLEAHPHAIRIGENTGGCIHFSNMGFFILPHSKLRIDMPCQYRTYRDKRFIERTGIAPHIHVPAGKDAANVAFTLLKQKLQSGHNGGKGRKK